MTFIGPQGIANQFGRTYLLLRVSGTEPTSTPLFPPPPERRQLATDTNYKAAFSKRGRISSLMTARIQLRCVFWRGIRSGSVLVSVCIASKHWALDLWWVLRSVIYKLFLSVQIQPLSCHSHRLTISIHLLISPFPFVIHIHFVFARSA